MLKCVFHIGGQLYVAMNKKLSLKLLNNVQCVCFIQCKLPNCMYVQSLVP